MDLYAILDQVVDLLRQRQRVTYRALKVQFHLEDEALEALKDELLYAHPQVRDDAGHGLVWRGDLRTAPLPASDSGEISAREPLTYTPSYLAEKILTSRSALEGERKQVTVLFADLKGSMELLADRDPEEARQLLDPVLERMMEAVHRYEGTVNQVMGDGIMALFGAPIAHEDHAIRACYAALAMQDAIRAYAEEVRHSHGLRVQIRVGLNAGEVVVRAIGNDLHMDYSAIGQTTHLAARMEQLATPGSILLTAATLRLVEGLVQVKALGLVPVKGLVEPVDVFELVGASALRGRFQARIAGGLTRFVGREAELAALQQALQQAGAGHGQMVAMVGEPGVGKSRLVYEFVRSHHTRGWLVLESASVSYGKATPYFPVIDFLKRYCHVEEHDDTRTIRAKVTGQLLTLDATLQEAIPALLSLLDALPEDSPFGQLDPSQRRQRMLNALKRVVLRESQEQPLLLIFEDLHWIDAETQALLDSLVESLPAARLLLLVNYRSEYHHGWGSKTFYTQIRLNPLPPASADELLHALLGDDASLAPLKQLLIDRTAGNPFFLEESVRTLVETGVLVREPGASRLAQPLEGLQVPATVQAILAARIDRLPPEEKGLLQTAAVIGTEWPFALLQAIAGLPEASVHGGLAHLQAAEFLYETRLFPEREYTFKHALTHEVAYSSLLQERRRVLHARIVEALEALAGDRLAEQVDRLAHHALRGEAWDKALVYGRQAGEKAMAQSAYQEAGTAFEGALTAVPHLPDSPERRTQAIDLRLALRQALLRLGAYDRILPLLEDAIALAEASHDQLRLGRVYRSLIEQYLNMGDPARALDAGQHALALATCLDDVALQLSTRATLARVYGNRGDYRQAVDLCRYVVATLSDDLLPQLVEEVGPGATRTRAFAAWSLAELGAFAEGVVYGREALQLAQTTPDAFSLVIALWSTGYLHLLRGALPQAMPLLAQSLDVCQANQMARFLPLVLAYLGSAAALAGRLPEALPLLEQAQALQEQARDTGRGSLTHQARILSLLSEGYGLAGRLDDARLAAERALSLARTQQARGSEAWALWLLGESTAHQASAEGAPAVGHYRQALALAEALGMRPLQAHCHRSLGTLYAKLDRREQARTELATAIALYRDMDMTFWLPQTEAALAQVEGR